MLLFLRLRLIFVCCSVLGTGERRRWVGVNGRPCGTDVEETESGNYGWGGCVRKIEVLQYYMKAFRLLNMR